MAEHSIHESHILVIDDEPANTELLERVLGSAGYNSVHTMNDSQKGLETILTGWPDLVLLDMHMPGVDGYEVLRAARSHEGSALGCPILVFTADISLETRRKALECGASDFLTKPGDITEILLRVNNFLQLRKLQRDLEETNLTLEDKVRERTHELWEANLEVVYRLAKAAEYRDDQTGEHINRVAAFAHRIAIFLEVPRADAELLRLAAPLHDVGKIALPDSILLKPGPLTVDERKTMQAHTEIGAKMLSQGKSEILRLAEVIALTHHERWDGQGYPRGLAGEDIPLAGRILAVADVFDALTHERPYKKAWNHEQAIEEIERNQGSQFDPQVVAAMMKTVRTADAFRYL